MSQLRQANKPNLFIVGAPKCGTTAWVEYLSSHPSIFFSPVKEPHHFNIDFPQYRWVKDRDEYLGLFDQSGDARVLGEASVFYLYSKLAAQEIKAFNPEARILIFIRNQEEYLPSLHNQILFNGDENITEFADAWRLSGHRDSANIGRHCREKEILNYEALGRFNEQVERYFANFPAEQVRVFHFDDWTRDPRPTHLEILRLLDVEDDGRTEFPRVNQAERRRLNWLAPWLRRPPRGAARWVDRLKRLAGVRSFGILRAARRLNSRDGYVSQAGDTLREEIREHYAADNARLSAHICKPNPELSPGILSRSNQFRGRAS
jgi:hypothetical protein